MDDRDSIPSLSSGVVGSRFVSQEDIDTAKARRDEQWKAAYARLGQEPPPQPVEEIYDGRSLAEKLAANKIAKQEEWEEKTKLANQFRALEEDEVMFLDSIREKEEAEERLRKELDGEEVQNFRQAIAARTSAASYPTAAASKVTKVTTKQPPTTTALSAKKPKAKLMKGVVVKKKSKAAAKDDDTQGKKSGTIKDSDSTHNNTANNDEEPAAKKRRLSQS